MTLVDRYVEAVRRQLPRAHRDDIAAELRETLLSEIEAAEQAAGAPLPDDAMVEVLRRFGSPDVIAGRYGARDHLIGPAVYSIYRRALKMMLAIFAAAMIAWAAATAVTADDPVAALARVAFTGMLILMGSITLLTLVFSRIDRMMVRTAAPSWWNPRELATTPRVPLPRADAVAGIAAAVFALLWWTGILPVNRWNGLSLELAPIWDALTPLVIAYMTASIAITLIAFVRPRWVRVYEAGSLTLDMVAAVGLCCALTAPAFIRVTDPASPAVGLAPVLSWVLFWILLVSMLVVVGSIASTIVRWSVPRQRRPASV